jgi:small subunit ribosomal protein S13
VAAKEKGKKKSKDKEVDEDFKFIVRILNTDIDGERRLVNGITSIDGVNYRIANIIARSLDVPMNEKIGSLSDEKIEELTTLIEEIPENLPDWMLNRRKDFEIGEDTHVLGTDLEMTQKDDINEMKKIKCYKGLRHDQGQKVRGQRTRANGRTGAIVGVSRSKVV